jgi:hypothetical protein
MVWRYGCPMIQNNIYTPIINTPILAHKYMATMVIFVRSVFCGGLWFGFGDMVREKGAGLMIYGLIN